MTLVETLAPEKVEAEQAALQVALEIAAEAAVQVVVAEESADGPGLATLRLKPRLQQRAIALLAALSALTSWS